MSDDSLLDRAQKVAERARQFRSDRRRIVAQTRRAQEALVLRLLDLQMQARLCTGQGAGRNQGRTVSQP